MLKAAVLVSGGGTNLQAIIDAHARGEIENCNLALVLSSKSGVYALTRAENAGIKTAIVEKKSFADNGEYNKAILAQLKQNEIDVIVLAGFLSILTPEVINAYPDKIINVHPSLIPSFCGEGYYGLKVHKAALARGVKLTGATVHLVNEIPDGGRILLQKAVEVLPDDTAETLQKRVMINAEWVLLPKALSMLCSKEM
ncbi:MAG: phosphoribosylglycinamide formyltransferase [Oscillospiraceae bacterium]